MLGARITELMDIWAKFNAAGDDLDTSDDMELPRSPPFANSADLYNVIDLTELGDVPWQAFSVKYNGKLPDNGPPPTWMTASYEVWFRDPLKIMESQISNPNFDGEIDYAPKQVFGPDGQRIYRDMMSGNWSWEQVDTIATDPEMHSAAFVPVILGTDKQFQDSVEFRKFRRQLFHSSLAHILLSLKPWMTKPRITRCADGHFRHVIYGLGPYIADYPEQALLASIVSGWCAKCTALSSDLDGISSKRFLVHMSTLSTSEMLLDMI
ncbi:hypothetical protein H0H81_005273 [Sphagnurus paluster]|uniref:Uncharacterized protein n=1 Tax=Sphagnurus paluster TaxID=117069 RepID=A0A9P7KEJ9_9AGAR|nr:hypothetical protein H0H81_005273 [Sphagnurus paluster]